MDAELHARVRRWLETAPEPEVFRINLRLWAPAWQVPLADAITHFLELTRAGVTEMWWEAHCTRCNAVLAREAALANVKSDHRCPSCLVDVQVRLDDHIEVTFSVARALREVGGRVPYEQTGNVVVFGEHEVPPGARVRVPARFGATRRVRVMTWKPTTLDVIETASIGGQPRIAMKPGEAVDLPPTLPRGDVELELVNERTTPATVLLEDHDMPEYTPDQLPAPRLTGLEVTSVPAFRALFHTDTLAQHETLAVREVTLVFTDIERSTELYQRIGDVAAYALVRRHFDVVFAAVTAHGGTIVKTIGDAVMASFVRSADAVAAFLAVQGAIAEIRLRAAIHRGPVVAVTLNDRLDFFGNTVNETARMEAECAPGELIVSDAAMAALDARVLAGCTVTAEMRPLAGLPQAYRLHRVRR